MSVPTVPAAKVAKLAVTLTERLPHSGAPKGHDMFSSLADRSTAATTNRGRILARRCAATVAAAVALTAGVAGWASAAPVTATGTTKASVAVETGIQMSGLTPSFELRGVPGTTATGVNAVTMKVTTNNQTGYSVTVQAAASTLAPASTSNSDSIPIAKLSVRKSGAGTYQALSSTTPVTVHTQATKSSETGDSLTNDYQIAIPFVNSDTYSVTLNYVAASL